MVAYQGADQLRQYGANIFVADLVGLSMLREFAPLITAIIIAGRSGSAYAAQIGTMAVTEEIDAMRTLGIAPLDLLVLPKVLALLIAMPLLTVFADVLGVFGDMIMAQAQLGVGFSDFLDRFVKAVSVTALMIGIGKAPVFAAIIAVVLTPSAAAGDLRLDTEIIRLQHEFGVLPSRVRFTLRANLVDNKTREVLAWREFDTSVAATSEDPYGGVVVANRAVGIVLENLAIFCAREMRNVWSTK